MRTSATGSWVILCLSIIQVCSFYSNKEAAECFAEKALKNCQEVIDQCNFDDCKAELGKHRGCYIGTEL
jgi:hypothetical protein